MEDSAVALKAPLTQVQQKLGRNMMLFQQVEGALKYIIANSTISGSTEELALWHESQQWIQTQTMGTLVRMLMEDFVTIEDEYSDTKSSLPDIVTKLMMSIKINARVERTSHAKLKNEFALMVDERNQLTHHFLQNWKLGSL